MFHGNAHWVWASLLLVIFAGCSGSAPGPSPVNVGAAAILPSGVRQDVMYTYTPASTLSGYTYLAANLPSWATLDPTTGVLTGCPTDPGALPAIVISAFKGGQVLPVATLNLSVTGDPFVRLAWHMGNTGQIGYGLNSGVVGQDMKIREASCAGASGLGVRIAVSDTGVEISHEDLKGNVIAGASRDYSVGSAPYSGNPVAVASADEPAHGTAVAGIVGAVGWNGTGVRGVAPEAGIAGFNYLSYQSAPGADIDQLQGNFDIFNQSWGPGFSNTGQVNYAPFDDANYLAALVSGVTSGRGGKGYLYLRAAGNDYYFSNLNGSAPFHWRSRNACMEADNSNPYVIVVGATNAKGIKSSYSSAGSCLWISGVGGEFAYDHPDSGAFPLFGVNDPAIITTDISGCSSGFSMSTISGAANQFELGNVPLNSNCNYTSVMNGTSSATPSISGVVAMMLEANANLSWRDVKYILAKTATKVDPSSAPLHNAFDPAGYLPDSGWITNAAGVAFHNWYGFGRADAQAAVAMAKTYSSALGTMHDLTDGSGNWLYSNSVNLAIADNNVSTPTAVDHIAVTQNYVIEAVEIRVSITHPFIGDLGIELISPAGTKSTLLNTNNADTEVNLGDVTLLSNAFYGESSAGNWTIRVLDGMSGNSGTLTQWKINIFGH